MTQSKKVNTKTAIGTVKNSTKTVTKTTSKKIAITGGIGSGKSTVLSIIAESFPVISCDEITRELYKKHYIKERLKEAFPTAVSGKTRLTCDKKAIANLCFTDDKNYKTLCDILTLEVYKIAERRAQKYPVCFVEVPLLFEYNLQDSFDNVIVVMRDIKARIESVKTRSNLTKSEIEKRIARQFDYSKIDKDKYIIINNDGSLTELKSQVKAILERL